MKELFDIIIEKEPHVRECPQYMPTGKYEGIKAITYEGVKLNDGKTKIFAYLGFPEDVSSKVPAVVLVHGGGGAPYLRWIKEWNDRGYAAIAMSTTGYFPTEVNAGADETEEDAKLWSYGLSGVFAENGYVDAPNNDAMQNSEKPIEEQWMYHAICDVILSNSILRCDSHVDENRIGIMGISWGGVIASLAIGYDKRFAFAIPVYGSGYLAEDMGYIGNFFRNGKNPDLWLAEKRFSEVDIPILWQCWNSDTPFSVNSNSKSYCDTVKNNEKTRLSIIHNMNHAHSWSWVRPEPMVFADFVCKGGSVIPFFDAEKGEVCNPDKLKIQSIKVYYITEPLKYIQNSETKGYSMGQEWNIEDYNGNIPHNAKGWYIEITSQINGAEFVSASPFFEGGI